MLDDSITISAALIAYAIVILGGALFCFIYDIKSLFKVKPRLVNAWNGDWYQFGFFLWGIILIFLFVQRVAVDLFARHEYSSSPYWPLILAGGVTQLCMLGFIFLCYKKIPYLYPRNLNSKDNAPVKAFLKGVFYFLGALPVIWLVGFGWSGFLMYLKSMGVPIEIKPQLIVEIFAKSKSPALIATIIIMATILAPVVEELIFRGGIYRFLKAKCSIKLAFFCSALFFSLLHFSLISILPLFVMGIFLAKSYERTGSIFGSMGLHAAFNLNTLILLLIEPDLPLMQQSGLWLNFMF